MKALEMKRRNSSTVTYISIFSVYDDFNRFSRLIPVFSTVKMCILSLSLLSLVLLYTYYHRATRMVRITLDWSINHAFPYVHEPCISLHCTFRIAAAYRNKCIRCKYMARISA